MSVFAPSVSSLWRQIEDHGIDAEALFKKHGVDRSTLFDTSARVSNLVIDCVAVEAAEQSGDIFFGVKEANYFLPSHIGPLGFAWLASTTMQSALERLQRYIKVIHEKLQVTIDYTQDGLVVSPYVDAPTAGAFHRDTSQLAVLTRMCRFIYGDEWNPSLVTIAHPPPADTSYFFEFFRCPVEFKAEKKVPVKDPTTGAIQGFKWDRKGDNENWDLLVYNNSALDILAWDIIVNQGGRDQVNWIEFFDYCRTGNNGEPVYYEN